MSAKRGEEFAGKRIAVIGLAATGLATAKVLRDLGAMVTVYDGKPEDKLDAVRVAEVRELAGVGFAPGNNEADWTATDLVIPSPGVPRYAPVLTEAVRRGVPILGEIEVAYRLAEAPILAITGTNGKTTTTALVGAICREAGLPTWVAGNIAEDAGKRLPLIQAAVEAPSNGVIVAEISSFQLEWVEQFRPKVAAWLNLSPDHLDRHKDMDEYARAKANIFGAQTADDFAVLNADDELVMRYSKGVGNARRNTFTLTDPGKGNEFLSFNETAFPRNYESRPVILALLENPRPAFAAVEIGKMQITGSHNIANTMAAMLIALRMGISISPIQRAVYNFAGVAHRMEFVEEINGVRYINNSMCTNPAAVEASAEASPKPLIAIAGGYHKGGDLSGMAKSLAQNAIKVLLIGQATSAIAEALTVKGYSEFEAADTLPDAVEKAARAAKPGDTVMLIPGCASFDMFTGFEERGQVFRDAVKNLTRRVNLT